LGHLGEGGKRKKKVKKEREDAREWCVKEKWGYLTVQQRGPWG